MPTGKKITIIPNLLYVLILIIFLLDGFNNPFEIYSQILKSGVYYGFVFGTPIILLWNLIFQEKLGKKIAGATLPGLMLIAIFAINPIKILFASESWKTQEIVYQSKDSENKHIEFQMRDRGALGYDKRYVMVTRFLNLIMVVEEENENISITNEWIRVDIEVNELGLKNYSQYK